MSTVDDESRFRPEAFRCVVSEGRASALVELHGELDMATGPEAEAALGSVLGKRRVTLDLRQLDFIDRTGLRLILDIDALARQDGFNFFVVRGPSHVQRLFALTQTEEHLVFIDAPEEITPPE